MRDAIESFKISQGVTNDQVKQETKFFKKEIKLIQNLMGQMTVYTESHDRKMETIDKEINKEKEFRHTNTIYYNYNPNLLNEYVRIEYIINYIFRSLVSLELSLHSSPLPVNSGKTSFT